MRIFSWFCCFLFLIGFAKAQQLPIDNQYLINAFSLSPAYAGYNSSIETFILHRQNWIGIEGAPKTSSFNLNGSITENMGLGGSISSDKIGVFKNFSSSLAYAYRLKFNDNRFLSFGLAAGFFESNIDITGSNNKSGLDPVVGVNQNMRNVAFDATAALAFQDRNLRAGLVVPRIIESEINEGTATYTLKRHYIFHSSYLIDLSSDLQTIPSVVLRKTASSNLFYEFATSVRYQKQLWMGINYRRGTSIGILAGFLINNKLAVNYSYEFGQGMLSNSSGNHEISLGFLLGKGKPNRFSVFSKESISRKKPYYKWLNN